MTEPAARIVADSINENGDRLTTFEVTFHRFVLAEFNTHCVFDRNSASSRAIPLAKQLERVSQDTAVPVTFPLEQPGMQGGDELAPEDLKLAELEWRKAALDAYMRAQHLGELHVHKSVANRILEPFMWHTVCVTATAYQNFFGLRCSPGAQPEIRVAAELMYRAYEESEPAFLMEGQWHRPYLRDDDEVEAFDRWGDADFEIKLCEISAARVARTSYLTQNGLRDLDEDIRLYERLTSADPMHASPLGQVARADSWNRVTWEVPLPKVDNYQPVFNVTLPKVGKLLGYRALRHDVEMGRRGYQSFS